MKRNISNYYGYCSVLRWFLPVSLPVTKNWMCWIPTILQLKVILKRPSELQNGVNAVYSVACVRLNWWAGNGFLPMI